MGRAEITLRTIREKLNLILAAKRCNTERNERGNVTSPNPQARFGQIVIYGRLQKTDSSRAWGYRQSLKPN
jgi:hypothetical protein